MDKLIEKLESLKGNWGGSNPWQEGYLKAVDKAIAIVKQHQAVCPFVITSDEGTSYCRLAAQNGPQPEPSKND